MITLKVKRSLVLPVSGKNLGQGSQDIEEGVFDKEKDHSFVKALMKNGVIVVEERQEVKKFNNKRVPPIKEERPPKSFMPKEKFNKLVPEVIVFKKASKGMKKPFLKMV